MAFLTIARVTAGAKTRKQGTPKSKCDPRAFPRVVELKFAPRSRGVSAVEATRIFQPSRSGRT